MAKIKPGEVLQIGDKKYRVVCTDMHTVSCNVCGVKNCAQNAQFKEVKRDYHVSTCEALIGVRKHFKEEPEPQVSGE